MVVVVRIFKVQQNRCRFGLLHDGVWCIWESTRVGKRKRKKPQTRAYATRKFCGPSLLRDMILLLLIPSLAGIADTQITRALRHKNYSKPVRKTFQRNGLYFMKDYSSSPMVFIYLFSSEQLEMVWGGKALAGSDCSINIFSRHWWWLGKINWRCG